MNKKAPQWLIVTVVLLVAASLIWLFIQAGALRLPKKADDSLIDELADRKKELDKWMVRYSGSDKKRNSLGR